MTSQARADAERRGDPLGGDLIQAVAAGTHATAPRGTAASYCSIAARARAEALPAEAVEFPVPYAAEEGVPLVRREHKDGSCGVSAVANADFAAWQARHLDTVAVGVAQ